MSKKNLGHLPFLDLLRGGSVFLVFAYHALAEAFTPHSIPWDGLFRSLATSGSLLATVPLQFGWMGVASFFVVSGFCVHLSWLRSGSDGWGVFLGRRFLRVYPPYLAVFLAVAAVLHLGGGGHVPTPSAANFGAHLLLLHNFHPSTIYAYAVSFWSIAVEFQLYLLFPVLIFVQARWGWSAALGLAAGLEIVLRLASATSVTMGFHLPESLLDTPFAYWFSWSIGALLADNLAADRSHALDRVPAWFWLAAVVASFVVLPLEPLDFTFASLLTYALLGRVLRVGWTPPGSGFAGALASHATATGVVSYSVYLVHEPILSLGMRGLDSLGAEHAHPLLRLSLCFMFWPFSVIAGKVSYKWLESPSIALGKSLARRVAARRSRPVSKA